jgi:lipopolysaccharide export system protein LptA
MKNSSVAILFLFTVLTAGFLSPTAAGQPGKAKPSPLDSDLVITAQSNEVTLNNGEIVLHYNNNVVARLSDIKITSRNATGMKRQGIWSFENGVTVTRGTEIIQCNRLTFSRATRLIYAIGNFSYIDTSTKTHITGKEANYHVDKKTFSLRGDPRLTKIDTATAETLVITGIEMSYADSLKKATAARDVKITKGKMRSTCQLANYYTNTNIAELRTKPLVHYDIHEVVGDSINLYFGKESLKNAVVIGNSHGIYIDTSGPQATDAAKTKKKQGTVRDTMYTHIWSDSLCMMVNDSGYLDSLWAYGRVNSKYYSSSDPNEANQANGKTMLLSFTTTGNLDYIRMWGNARSIYFIDDPGGNGENEASGDTIVVLFNPDGKAKRLRLIGSARGMYYPQ